MYRYIEGTPSCFCIVGRELILLLSEWEASRISKNGAPAGQDVGFLNLARATLRLGFLYPHLRFIEDTIKDYIRGSDRCAPCDTSMYSRYTNKLGNVSLIRVPALLSFFLLCSFSPVLGLR